MLFLLLLFTVKEIVEFLYLQCLQKILMRRIEEFDILHVHRL